MMPSIPEVVKDLVAGYVADGRAKDAYEINCGSCQDFAAELIRALDDRSMGLRAYEIWVDDLLQGDPLDDERGDFDRERVERDHPATRPPEDLGWDGMDVVAKEYDFAGGTHVWVVIEDRHYDAEAPEGVDNAFDLPFFKRKLDDHRANLQSSATP